MKLKFLGAAGIVTGSSFLVESTPVGGQAEGERILVDCGIFQGGSYCERLNFEPLPYDPKSIKAIFITHAHIDHTGMLPRLVKLGYPGPIYSTAPTRDSSRELLLDSEDILKKEAERYDMPPLYTTADIDALMRQWESIKYGEQITVGAFKVELQNAGHILGSASAIIEVENKKLVVSGDLGNNNPPLIYKGELIPPDADYCLIESSYGDRVHEDFAKRREMLEDVIEDTARAKGVLIIPVFAMERMQELLYEINELINQGRVPKLQIFIDSPLAIRLTKVYERYPEYLNPEARKFMRHGSHDILNFPGVHAAFTHEESEKISAVPAPKIIFAGSGMSNGGRILRHEAQYLPDSKNTILFVGYQAAGTLGRQILDGAKEVKIFGEIVPVRARVAAISGYSAHADQARLLEWLVPARDSLKKVFVVHGDKIPSEVFAVSVRDKLAVKSEVPSVGEEVVL
jgi:metallo-beta-lactamase family protein